MAAVTWWRRLRRAVLVRVARIASARVRGLLVELAVEREARVALLAEHEVQLAALRAEVDRLRQECVGWDLAVQSADQRTAKAKKEVREERRDGNRGWQLAAERARTIATLRTELAIQSRTRDEQLTDLHEQQEKEVRA